jgi:hypothetical protein
MWIADAVRNGGRSDASLPYYERAATLARAAAEAGGGDAPQAWLDLGAIAQNWGNALRDTGKLGAAGERFLESAQAEEKAGSPAVSVIGGELEALRIDIMQGHADRVLPQVKELLGNVEGWWQRHRAGERVPEAPDPERLARTLISALDIATVLKETGTLL